MTRFIEVEGTEEIYAVDSLEEMTAAQEALRAAGAASAEVWAAPVDLETLIREGSPDATKTGTILFAE